MTALYRLYISQSKCQDQMKDISHEIERAINRDTKPQLPPEVYNYISEVFKIKDDVMHQTYTNVIWPIQNYRFPE